MTVLRLSKTRRQMVAFWSIVWRYCDARQGVAEHPVSPIVDTGNARRPPRVANFLHIDYILLYSSAHNRTLGAQGPLPKDS